MARLLIVAACILAGFLTAPAGGHTVDSTLTGTVVSVDGDPVEFVNVTAFAGDSITGGGMTAGDGSFRINLRKACDRVRFSSIGYSDTTIYAKGMELGRVVMRKTSTTLGELEVGVPLITREADRILLNVSANPLSADKDARELLQTAPGVWADDNSLSIYGRGGTVVYVDENRVNMSGEKLMSYLKSIKSSSISTIEIIPVAGAEYSANSAGGVIRINLKRNRIDGLDGSAGFGTTVGEYKRWFNPSANLSLHKDRLTVNLSASVNGTPSDRFSSNVESTYPAGMGTLRGASRHKSKTLQGNAMLNAFYDISPQNRLGIQIDFNTDRTDGKTDSRTDPEDNAGKTFPSTLGQYDSRNDYRNLNMALNWIHDFGENGGRLKWITNYNFQSSGIDEHNRMSWTNVPDDSVYTVDNNNRYNVFVTELAVNKPLNDAWTLDAGAKYTFNNVDYKSLHSYLEGSEWIPNAAHDYAGNYDEHIGAPYFTISGRYGRWKFKAGLRAEYFKTRGEGIGYTSLGWFPNANVTFNLRKTGDYTASAVYYRNIRRPSFQSLNPVVRQVSDYTYNSGNPDLRPSYADGMNLSFMFARKFTVSTGMSWIKEPIHQVFQSIPEYPEKMCLTWDNDGNEWRTFIHGDGSLSLTKWWNLYSSITYMFVSQKSEKNSDNESFGYLQLIASTTFRLPWSVNLTCNCFYNSRMRIGNIHVSPLLNINPTLQRRFGKAWSIAIGVENMLQRTNRTRTSTLGYDRLAYTKRYMAFRFSATYNFNTGKGFRSPRIESNADKSRLSKE